MASHKKTFYVYQITDGDIPVYIGKGSGKRRRVQSYRFKLPATVIKEFSNEDEAFKFERQMIAEYNPIYNRNPGGGGGRVKIRVPRKPRLTKEYALMAKIGTRVYAARILWACRKSLIEKYGYTQPQIDRFHALAYPPEIQIGI